jgi:hypothetical protein
LLSAVALLPKSLNTQVEIVGDGGERKALESQAEQLGISEQVQFLGHISEQELPKAYERATLFAMPSIAELQSIATMEAMASGRPVVAADAMALPHLVHDGDNGYLFPPNDVDVFADRLLKILTADKKELARLSDNSLYLIQSHDIERTLNIFEGLYRGDKDAEKTSDDNREGYLDPIGRLNARLKAQVVLMRKQALALREASLTLVDKAEELAEDAVRRAKEANAKVKKSAVDTANKAKSAVKEVAERLRSED